MNAFTIQRIKASQLASFEDECTIDVFSSGSNTYREIIKSWVSGSAISCGYKNNLGNRAYGETEQRLKFSAIVRIDNSVTVTTSDKVTITKISGSSITPVQYKISSIQPGHGIWILGCENVEV